MSDETIIEALGKDALDVIVSPAADEDGSEQARGLPQFPVVCVGASAGGLAAFGAFLAVIPLDTGMAFVLVQHLAPLQGSRLAEILAKDTRMPVTEVSDGMEVAPNHVYVIAPNVNMAIEKRVLRLTPRVSTHGLHLSIDFFMRSLAADRASRAIGVVLSGTGSDGTLGLAEIKAAGGITFAQDPASAESAEMPASAIAYGSSDFALNPAEIAHEIARISRHAYLREGRAYDADPFPGDGQSYAAVLAVLKNTAHIDFELYRASTIKRRILRRMALRNIATLVEYVRVLGDEIKEAQVLLKDVLINVTSFFRDQVVFDAVKNLVFPRLTKERVDDAPIRIWVVACSTGQEAYSLAMELIEHVDGQQRHRQIQIFATDISEGSLATARIGVYPASIEAEVSPERLRRHFTKVPEGYRINKSIRDLCVFAKHDVTADTPFSKIDVISCRNVLIYLTPALQARVIPTFHYTLNAGGFLVLGSSETVGRSTDLFDAVDAKNRVYVKKAIATRIHPPLFPGNRRTVGSTDAGLRAPSLSELQRAADRIVLGRYAPAGVLVDAENTIIQFRGQTASFLDPAQGQASLNLLKMVPHGLAQELSRAIDEAKRQNVTVRRKGVRLRDDQRLRLIDIEISLVRLPGSPEPAILILFEEAPDRPLPQATMASVSSPAQAAAEGRDYAQLKQELTAANDYMESLTEENNAVNDELRFANDESTSANEELRCTNEELQTAKEEVESANEELATLNEELRNRNLELTGLSNDLTNLLDGIDLPVVMLDGEQRIRRLSGPTAQVLHLGHADLGRSIGGLDLGFSGPGMDQVVDEVMRTRMAKAVEVRNRAGHWFSLRITPYLTEGGGIAGAVATYIDIEASKRIQETLRKSGATAKAIVETVRDPLLVLDADLLVQTANRAFFRVFGLLPENVLKQCIYRLGDGEWDIPELKRLLDLILDGGGALENFEVTHEFKDLGRRTMLLNARLLEGSDDGTRKIVLAIADITERKRVADELASSSAELQRSNSELAQFASVASHDLQEPLRTIRSYTDLLQRRYGEKLDDKGRQYMDFVGDATSRLQALIRAILDYSKVGHNGVEARAIDAGAVARAALGNLEKKIVEASAVIEIGPLPQVVADPTLFAQLIQNLVSNAVKFKHKDRTVVVALSAREDEREWVFTVADNGIGIRAEDTERIFGLFQRVHAVSEYPGAGIGLATCKKIVERHGGRLWVESTIDIGTAFHFSIPKP